MRSYIMKTTQLLWEFIKQFKWRYIIGIIILLITSFISSMIPKIMGYVTDSINDKLPPSVTNKYLLMLVTATVAVFVLRFTWRYFLVGNNRYLECYLREKLFGHMQTLPASFYDNNKTGDLIAYAINDIQAIRRVFGFGFTSVLDGLVVNTISIMIMVRTINPILTLMAVAPAPIIVMIIYFLRKKIRERFGAVQKAFAEISGKVQENISGIRVIKAFAQEEEEVQDFLKYNQARVDTQMSLTRVSAILGPVTQLTFGISTVLFIIYGSGLVAKGVISLGDYVAFSSYITVIMGPIIRIGRIIDVWQRGFASVQRLDRIFCERSERDAENALATITLFGLDDQAEDDSTKTEKLKGHIIIRNLHFAYPGINRKVLQGIDLEIKEGETLGILGRTGSGKTTLVNLLLRLYEVEDGHIFIGGRDINHIPLKVLRESIGYVPQDNFLFSTTIKNNIQFFKPVYSDRQIEHATKMAGIYDEIMSFPEGFNTVVGERGMTLSGGQKQRVSIARAIVKDPSILILDDSLSAVDTKTEEKILGNLKNVLKGRTGIVISHRVSVVRYCDHIIFLDEGRIIERGTHEELMELKGAYYNLYMSQMEQVEDNLLLQARG